jgi:hypothetical protein
MRALRHPYKHRLFLLFLLVIAILLFVCGVFCHGTEGRRFEYNRLDVREIPTVETRRNPGGL